MTRKVKYSAGSVTWTVVALCILAAAWFLSKDKLGEYLALAALGALLLSALWYMPISVTVNDRYLCVHRPLRSRPLLLSHIASVKLCAPTMAERRIVGSGGWFGYWGRFKEPSIGHYFAYYGKSSDCFLVTLTNGQQYVIGCESPDEVVSYIQNHLSRR